MQISASANIFAPPADVYSTIANYRDEHRLAAEEFIEMLVSRKV